MRITRVEIIGFKSFCDRSVINIDHNITSVVGPNGCGKSNIVDAIRWCMGEQSAKHLRGKAMDDVIFAGSDGRGPASMAEVTLTFDDVQPSRWMAPAASTSPVDQKAANDTEIAKDTNSDEGAEATMEQVSEEEPTPEEADSFDIFAEAPPPVDFSQFTEVAVTRRLFRDGTSQYMINRIPCRLRDIQDFFMGSGVGTKAYSIIEQGRVGQIVSSRPGDRRAIIEEAAGITKFKSKRRAAQRRLEQTKQNLARVSDIVTELETRQASLKRQAQKAERYRSYKNELRGLELWQTSFDYLRLKSANRSEEHGLSDAKKRLSADRKAIEELDGSLNEQKLAVAAKEQEVAKIKERIFELENESKLAENRKTFLQKEQLEIAERIKVATARRGEIFGAHQDKEQAILEQSQGLDSLMIEHEATEKQLADRRTLIAALESEVTTLTDELRISENKRDEARERFAVSNTQATSSKETVERLQQEVAKLELESEQLQQELKGLAAQCRQEEARLASLKQTQLDLGNRLEQLQENKDRLAAERRELATKLSDGAVQLAEQKSRLKSLVEIQRRCEGMPGGTKVVLSDDKRSQLSGIRGLVADKLVVPAHLELAIEAALGSYLSAIVVDDSSAALVAIEMLRQEEAGAALFVSKTSSSVARNHEVSDSSIVGYASDLVEVAPGYEFLAQTVLANTLIVQTTSDALRMQRVVGGSVVSMQGDVIDERGLIWGCQDQTQHAGILARKREIEELEAEIKDLQQKQAWLEGESHQAQERLQNTERALDQSKKEAHEKEVAVVSAEKDAESARQKRDSSRESLAKIDSEKHQLILLVESKLKSASEAAREVQELQAEIELLASRIEHLTSAVRQAQSQHVEAADSLRELEVRAATLHEKKSSVASTAQQLKASMAESAELLARIEESLAADTVRSETVKSEAAGEVATIESLIEQKDKAATNLASGMQELTAAHQSLTEADAKMRELRQGVETLSEKANASEVSLANAATDLRVLAQTLYDRHQLTIADILHDYHRKPLPSEEEVARSEELRRLLRRMGDVVNLTAIEEYREVSERYEYLAGQRDDLENAVEQLEKAIGKINRTSRKIFKETYEAVNAQFQELFPKLFRGGKAHLALTEAEDILEAGVEIFARPPGKKNSTVEQLSGGEKALTAVALIFSIFLIKPSPFCILDEVDAPLDDANVDRYNEIVRSMTDRSQFIVITHNKRTMEIADSLYGVTMQVPGVSKLVGVALSKLEKNAS